MTARLFAPAHALVASLIVGFAVCGTMLVLATQQPWVGVVLAFDAQANGAVVRRAEGPAATVPVGTIVRSISGGGDRLDLRPVDFTIEPDGAIPTYDDYADFLDRQERLSRIQAADTVTLHDAQGGAWSLRPEASRPLASLPPDFWVQVFVGLAAWLIASAIWAFRQDDTSARYLLLSGAATLVFSPFAAVYTTRELALPAVPFHWLDELNFLGGSLYAAALVSIFLYYPRRLAPRWVGWAVVALYTVWFAAQALGAFESMVVGKRILVLLGVIVTFVLAGVHWRLTRKDPVARAALQWFLLSWLVCIVTFCAMIFIPQIFGVDTSALQGYSFLLFLLIYLGLALGVVRFRLFELGEWWLRVVVWTGCLAVMVALDLAFVAGLQLSGQLSLSLALLICGVLWLPLRGWVWGRLAPQSNLSERAKFESVVEVALTPGGEEQAQAWRNLIQRLFEPLNIEAAEGAGYAGLERDGLALVVPGGGSVPAFKIEYAQGGRRLFSRRDLALAEDLSGMFRHALQSRRAYEEGVAVERQRISRDMHDNIGAQLLRALHSPGEERKDRLIRETLSDLGGIIADSLRSAASLDEALGDLRCESSDRLAAAGLTLEWPLGGMGSTAAPPRLVHAVRSIIREALSNVIKHAGASHVRVDIRRSDGALRLDVEDNGVGCDGEASGGNGLANIRARAAAAGGSAHWGVGASGQGARLTVVIPLGR